MPNTTNNSLPYPSASDTVDVPRDIQALADALDTKSLRISASTSSPSAPTEGMLWYQTNTDALFIYTGTAWVQVIKPSLPPGLQLVKSGSQAAAATHDITSCFSTEFDSYRVHIRKINVSTANRSVRLNYLVGTTVQAGSEYHYVYGGLDSAAVAKNLTALTQTFAETGVILSTSGTALGSLSMDVHMPGVSGFRTFAHVQANGLDTQVVTRYGHFEYINTQAVDGFRITLSGTGNVSFDYAVYGYRN